MQSADFYVMSVMAFTDSGFWGVELDTIGIDRDGDNVLRVQRGMMAVPRGSVCRLPLGFPSATSLVPVYLAIPLATPEVVSLWNEENVTGWSGAEVLAFDDRRSENIGTAVLMSITGRCGGYRGRSIIADHGLIVTYRGLDLDMSGWQGEDLFVTEAMTSGLIFATDRLKNICEVNNVGGLQFTSLHEYRLDLAMG